MLSIPIYPESHHEILQSLANYSDRELIRQHQLYPEQGKFFAAFFYRYSEIVYNVTQQSVQSSVQADYLFATTWHQIFQELYHINLAVDPAVTNWQKWLEAIATSTLDRVRLPAAVQIRYRLAAAPPPLWCYLQRGLDRLSPLSRLIVVMNQNFQWNEQRICAYLQGEGEKVSATTISDLLTVSFRDLEAALPQDIREIYLVASKHRDLIAK